MDLSLVVPLYNEEEGCKTFAESLSEVLTAHDVDYELILVDNGSTDRTGEILRDLQRENPRIKMVNVAVNEGYGWGIINGLRVAKGDYIGYLGGDEQVKSEDVLLVYRKLVGDKLDFCKALRIVRFDGVERSLTSWVYNRIFPWFFPVGTCDVNGTPKIFTKAALKKVFPTVKDWFIDAEIMVKAKRSGLNFREVEIEFLARKTGSSNVRLATVWEFVKNFIYYKYRGFDDA